MTGSALVTGAARRAYAGRSAPGALRRVCALALAVAAAIVAVPGGSGAVAPAVKGSRNVPVVATFEIQQGRKDGDPVARGAIHGVRRVEGATVLYYSLGFPDRNGFDVSFPSTQRPPGTSDRWSYSGTYASPRLIDSGSQRRAYTTLVVADNGNCLCSGSAATQDVSGKSFVLYNVYPALPATTQKVAVSLGFTTVVADVAVEDGPLLPAVDPTKPIVLGTGWPRIDPAAVAAAPEKDRSIHDLETRVADLGNNTVTIETPAQVSIELSADVLFALDSAVLTPQAQEAIAKVATTVNERAKTGNVKVIGHTDNTGDDAHNDVLSKQRAEAVRAALEPLLKVAGLKFQVEGRGEREPIADNDSDANRQANRRVSVAFEPQR